jgi:hypothetical protein
MATRFYTAPDGTRYPLKEARYNIMFTIYRSDRSKAVQGDPERCIEALGIKHDKDVLHAFVGAGRDAYVVFKATDDEPATAFHFVIKSQARGVLDNFDKERSVKTQDLRLHRPTKGRTLEARAKMDGDRAKRIKAGEHVPKKTFKPRKRRVDRLGVPNRPRARISKRGDVSMAQKELNLTAAE